MTTALKLHSVTKISESELAVRMCEASCGMKRPRGATAAQALNGIDGDSRDRWLKAARAAMEYWRECIEQSQRIS